MELSDFLTNLNNMLGDSNNFALTTDQKTQNLTSAFNDNYAVTPVWDNSLTFSISTYQYELPSTINVVQDVYLERDVSQFPEAISRELWEVVAGNLQFNNVAHWTIPDTYPLWLKGYYKVTIDDEIDDVRLQEYILSLAGWFCLRNLQYTKLNSFLRNDTTIQDLMQSRQAMWQDVINFRQQLVQNDFTAT
jgi:hypothetical protein